MYMVGVIAAIAALLGAAVGSTATISAARTQVDGQSSAWVRDERKKLYVQVIEKISIAWQNREAIQTELFVAERTGQGLTSDSIRASVDTHWSMKDEPSQLTSQVSLLASEKTREGFSIALRELESFVTRLDELIGALGGRPGAPDVSTALTRLRETVSSAGRGAQFIEAVRTELGIP